MGEEMKTGWKQTYYVYGLVNPLTKKVFYIGCTYNTHQRMQSHRARKSGRLGEVCKKIKENNKKPKLIIFWTGSKKEAFKIEKQKIKQYAKRGCQLANRNGVIYTTPRTNEDRRAERVKIKNRIQRFMDKKNEICIKVDRFLLAIKRKKKNNSLCSRGCG